MADKKKKKLKLYFVTGTERHFDAQDSKDPVNRKEFVIAPSKASAEKIADEGWEPGLSLAVTRVRLKQKGFLKHFKANAK